MNSLITMKVPRLAAVAALFSIITAPALNAQTYLELEHARANARAGGPVSEYDVEILQRWGATSGTPGWRNSFRQDDASTDEPARNHRHREHRRLYRD